jgi:hypothetical protein
MVGLIDGRHDDRIQHGQKGGPCSCTQGWGVNGVCVEKSSAAELRVFSQTTHTYYKPVNISDRLQYFGDYNMRHTNFPGLSTERRHAFVAVVLQLKHCRRTWSPSFIFASSVKMTGGAGGPWESGSHPARADGKDSRP